MEHGALTHSSLSPEELAPSPVLTQQQHQDDAYCSVGGRSFNNSHDCLACDSSAQLARPWGKSQAFRSGVIQLPEAIDLQKGLEGWSQLWYRWPSLSARLDVTEGVLIQGLPSRVENTDLNPSVLRGQQNTPSQEWDYSLPSVWG